MTEYTEQLQVDVSHKKPNYLMIFGVLAIITLMEVTVASGLPVVLVLLSLTKIALVASYYMHLRSSNGWFSAIFMVPVPFLMLIVAVLLVAMAPGPDNSAAAAGICSFF